MSMPAVQISGVHNAQLIALVAHELRHPLLPIRHAAELLRDAVSDAGTVRRAVEIIDREAENMNRLIGDLVDVSRMQSGALELLCKRAPLFELMERAIESVGLFAREHGHPLSVSVSPEPIYLKVDVLRLCQALHNIIANVCQYTDKHGDIHVRAQRHGERVSIVVGNAANVFAQAGQGGRTQAGLGLGVYLARCIVDAHGGTMTAASAGANRGSEFTIELPCELSTAMIPEPAGGEPAVDRSPA